MSITKPMKELSVEQILQSYNLIVPEIQREYVWGYNEYGIFETFITDLKEGFNCEDKITPEIEALEKTINNPLLDKQTKESLALVLESLCKPSKSINIGFLYSYKPGYYVGNDREEDLYLIDGQQRFTTLFLILFYFSIKENRKEDFISLFKFDASREKIAFDYRVRSITHQFVFDLINNMEGVEDLLEIRNKQWFLYNYENDVTIKSIIGIDDNSGVFKLLNRMFDKDEKRYFDYIKRDIKFWHFKTEETSQGEELYITMNSRGQQLADNETIRAKLFDSDQVKANPLEWSEKWEQWQDFFWKNRYKENKKLTADEGFNEFLRWVQLLKMYEINDLYKTTPENASAHNAFIKNLQWESGSKLDIQYLSLYDIELTFKSLHYLFVDLKIAIENNISNQYSRVFERNNLIRQKWISFEDGIVSQIDLFQLLPLLLFCKKHFAKNEPIDALNLFRLIRSLFSLSQDETIAKAIRKQIVNILSIADSLNLNEDVTALLNKKVIYKTIMNNELIKKLELYEGSTSRLQMENLFWFAEDLGFNEGEISHLIDLTNKISSISEGFDLITFEKIIDVFKELIDNIPVMWGNLLNTDVYTDSIDRIAYDGSWYKRKGFLQLITERISSTNTLEEFITYQQKKFIQKYATLSEMQAEPSSKAQLYIYYIILVNKIFKNHSDWSWDGENFGKFPKFQGYKSHFNTPGIFQFYNTAFRENENKILQVHKPIYKEALEKVLEWAKT